jgi:hypothetical protein
VNIERVADLGGQLLVVHAHDHPDARVDAPGVEGHLQIGQIVVGGQDDRARFLGVQLLEDARLAPVPNEHRNASTSGGGQVGALRVFLENRHVFAQTEKLFQHPDPHLSQPAKDDVIL